MRRANRWIPSGLAALALLLLAAGPAEARERRGGRVPKSGSAHREVTRTGPGGEPRTRTQDSTWQRGDGAWTRDTTHTGPGGRQGTTQVEGQRSGDGWIRSKTSTGPGGRTATTNDELHRTEGGYVRDTTRTGANGGVTTRHAEGSYDPESRTFSKDVTTTLPSGKTLTQDVEVQRTEDGYTRDSVVTGPGGGVTTRESVGTWDPETKTWTRETTTTGPGGQSGATRATTTLGPAGE